MTREAWTRVKAWIGREWAERIGRRTPLAWQGYSYFDPLILLSLAHPETRQRVDNDGFVDGARGREDGPG
jgi:hypothetical protein